MAIRRRSIVLAGAFLCLIIASVILWPKPNAAQTELVYYQQQIAVLKNNTELIQTENSREVQNNREPKNIDAYEGALLTSLGVCQQIENHSSKVLESYQDRISQLKLFCKDYKDVAEYAYKKSKATRQFVTSGTLSFGDLGEILNYTKSDLGKLKSGTLNDPGLGEQITAIDNLQQKLQQSSVNSSISETENLLKEAENQKFNIVTARNYFWNNTVQLDAISRSIVKLQDSFNS